MKKYIYLMTLCFALLVSACVDANVDESTGTTSKITFDAKLVEVLKDKGYSFDSSDNLIMNSYASSTTVLDLSGCDLESIVGLINFTYLVDVDLSNNNLEAEFNFKNLPSAIQKVNISGNSRIDSYEALIYTSGASGRSNLTHLVLPEQAYWNTDEILRYKISDASADVSVSVITSEGDELEYTLTRDIPDATLRAQIYELYPSIFEGDQIDISKSIEEAVDFIMYEPIADLTGAEYVFMNSGYGQGGGYVQLYGSEDAPYELKYVFPGDGVVSISMRNVDTPNLWATSSTSSLKAIRFYNNSALTELTETDLAPFNNYNSYKGILGSELCFENCENLVSIDLGSVDAYGVSKIELTNLPALTTVNLSQLASVYALVMSEISSATISTPVRTLSGFSDGWGAGYFSQVSYAFDTDAESKMSAYMTSLAGSGVTLYDESFVYLTLEL